MQAPANNTAINEWDPSWFNLIPSDQRTIFEKYGYYSADF